MDQQTIDALMAELDHGDRAFLLNVIEHHLRGSKFERGRSSSFLVNRRNEKFRNLDLMREESFTTGKKRIKTHWYIVPTERGLALHDALLAYRTQVAADTKRAQAERYALENKMLAGPHFYDALKPIMDRVKIGEPLQLTIDEINSINIAIAMADGKIDSPHSRADLPA